MPPYGYTDDSSFFFFSSKIQHRAHFLYLWARSKNSKNGHIYQCTSVHYCQFFLEFLMKQCKGHAILSNIQWIKLIYKKCLWRIFPIPKVLLPWKLNFPAKTKSRGGKKMIVEFSEILAPRLPLNQPKILIQKAQQLQYPLSLSALIAWILWIEDKWNTHPDLIEFSRYRFYRISTKFI